MSQISLLSPDPIALVRSTLAAVTCPGDASLISGVHMHRLELLAADTGDEVGPSILHISEALDGGLAGVEELESPEVGRLLFRHKGAPDAGSIFVPAGTLVRGGGQNRIVSLSTLLMPGEVRNVEVRCVEKGRWTVHRDREFTGTGSSPLSLKSHKLSRDSTARLREARSRASDQGETWNDVDRHLESRTVTSHTSSLFDAIDQRAHMVVELPERLAGAAGAWMEGETTGGEVFVSAGLRRAGMRSLAESAVSDGGGDGADGGSAGCARPTVSFGEVQADVSASPDWKATEVPGGTIVDFRGARSGVVGSAFVAATAGGQGRVIHVAMAVV